MSTNSKRYLIATIEFPAIMSLQDTAQRLNSFMSGIVFEEEETGRFEEVPAFFYENKNVEFILFGIPEDEVGDAYMLKFYAETMLEISEYVKSAPQFVKEFAVDKLANHRGYIDYSEELANLLRNLGYGECVPLPQVD